MPCLMFTRVVRDINCESVKYFLIENKEVDCCCAAHTDMSVRFTVQDQVVSYPVLVRGIMYFQGSYHILFSASQLLETFGAAIFEC